jgi:23S rRNA (adenine2503-C2)-methyltransferase
MEVLDVTGDPQVAEVCVARFRQDDGCTTETVDGLTPPQKRDEKWVINISTQFGCPVGCPFCDAALQYRGNLTADELLDQVRWALGRHPGMAARCRKLKVHFARMGEPALNPAVLDAMERLPGVVGSSGLWCCVATVTPRGREAWFERLLLIKRRLYPGRFQLQFSVQSTSPEDRARLIPIPHWSLQDLARFGRRFFEPGDRKVVLNFALARDVEYNPEVIEKTFDPGRFAIKLTPVNPTAAGAQNGFETILRSEQSSLLDQTCQRLTSSGYDVVISVGDEREDQIGSNCGQAVRVERELAAERNHELRSAV